MTTSPMTRTQVVDQYFMEHRARLIDIAAFLDRCDRAKADASGEDFRMTAFREAVKMLLDDKPGRAQRILEYFSDQSSEPIAKAPMKGALGASVASPLPRGREGVPKRGTPRLGNPARGG
jgi:hypothetical protein